MEKAQKQQCDTLLQLAKEKKLILTDYTQCDHKLAH